MSAMDSLAATVSLSGRLISRFRHPLEVTPPYGSPEAKKTKRQKRKDEAEALAMERRRQKELESTDREANENFNLFPETLKSVTFTEKNTQLTDVLKVYGTRNLPDFDSFKEKVGPSNRTGVVNMAHKGLGDDRCIILSTAMIETGMSEDGDDERDDKQAIFSLSLCDNRISDLGMVTVMDNVMLSTRLRALIHLDMSHNKIGPNGAMALAKCVCKLPNLQRLNLSNMNLTDGILHDILFLFCNCQHKSDEDSSPHLKSLILSKNHMRTNAAIALASYLSSANGLDVIELDVSWNSLGIEGGSKLWTVISTHESLVSLDMSWNALGNHNHEELAEKVHPPLELNPMASSLDGEGSLVTAGSSYATGVDSVLLQQNPITSRAPDFEVVPIHGHFKKVKKIEYVSATALASVLNVNNTLLHLNLSHNAFCAKECDIIGGSLRDNHTLLGLHITG
jgi:Ran GTPase-activating protein (RanGAP) involved in mRNA processing and transport